MRSGNANKAPRVSAVKTDEGYELTVWAYSETLQRIVAIPSGAYTSIEEIRAAYPATQQLLLLDRQGAQE